MNQKNHVMEINVKFKKKKIYICIIEIEIKMPCGCRRNMNTNATPSVARYQSVPTQQKHVQTKQRQVQTPNIIFSRSPLVEKLYQDIEKLK